MKKSTVKELERRMADGYAARQELQDRKDADLNKQNAGLVGICQKYRNSYGGDSKGWWLYRRIISVDGQWCKAFRFQLTENSHIDFDLHIHDSINSSWITIPEAEFTAAFELVEDAMYSAAQRDSNGK